MTTASTPPDPPAPFVTWTVTLHGLSPDLTGMRRDEHGAAHIYLDEDRYVDIRIAVEQSSFTTPERHAAELERDRQGLLRLAELATQLAQEIKEIQEAGQ